VNLRFEVGMKHDRVCGGELIGYGLLLSDLMWVTVAPPCFQEEYSDSRLPENEFITIMIHVHW